MANNVQPPSAEFVQTLSFSGTLAQGESFESDWVLLDNFAAIRAVADVDTASAEITGTFEFSPDKTAVFDRLTRTGVITGPFTSLSVTTPAARYVRVCATNTGTITTGYVVQVHLHRNTPTAPVVPLFFPLNVTSLALTVRSAITGLPEGANPMTGNLVDVKTRADGQLIVAPGARLSQTGGRAHQEVNVLNPTPNTTLFTVPAGKNFHITSARFFGFNTSTTSSLLAFIRDGVGGPVKGGLAVEESSTGLGGVTKADNISASHQEPVLINNSVYWQVQQGAFSGAIVLVGYLEDE